MPKILSNNVDQEIQLALLNSREQIDRSFSDPVAYRFEGTQNFPPLSDWEQHDIVNSDYSFDGVEFTDINNKLHVTLTMSEARSGLKNILGKYSVDDQGVMRAASILSHNTREVESGQQYSFLHDAAENDLQFFLVANGQAYNKSLEGVKDTSGALKFIVGAGTENERLAKITDDPSEIKLVYETEGKTTEVEGNVYHTASPNLNRDSKVHAISGFTENDKTTLRVGFEDFPNLGDKDFNDVVFDINMSYFEGAQNDPAVLNTINTTSGDSTSLEESIEGELGLFGFGSQAGGLMAYTPLNEGDLLEGSEASAAEVVQTLVDLAGVIEEALPLDDIISNFIDEGALNEAVTGDASSVQVAAKAHDFSYVSDIAVDFPNDYVEYSLI